ncbi:hypothetical protein UlMin_033682 [Ulmus minor]
MCAELTTHSPLRAIHFEGSLPQHKCFTDSIIISLSHLPRSSPTFDSSPKYLPRFQAENAGHNFSIFEQVNEIAARKGCTPAHRSPVSETHTRRNGQIETSNSKKAKKKSSYKVRSLVQAEVIYIYIYMYVYILLIGIEECIVLLGFSLDRGDSLVGDATTSGIYETVQSEVRRAISEIKNDLESAIQRSNILAIATTNIADIALDLVNPSAVELVLDIIREYAKKLERERARKLRSDLAIEEHRGLELNRMLKEVLPNPKSSNVPKSRLGRKASIERRKISKHLMEQAMAYFGECVSLSTFDSSDFSSPEDLPLNIVGGTTGVGNGVFSLQASSGVSATDSSSSCFKDKQQVVMIKRKHKSKHLAKHAENCA